MKGSMQASRALSSTEHTASFGFSYGRILPHVTHCRVPNRPGTWRGSQWPALQLSSTSRAPAGPRRVQHAQSASSRKWWPPWGWRGQDKAPTSQEVAHPAALMASSHRRQASLWHHSSHCCLVSYSTVITMLQCPKDKVQKTRTEITQ